MTIEDKRDALRRTEPSEFARLTLTRTSEVGDCLSLSVDPCSWLYPGHGTQVCVTLAGSGRTHFKLRRDGQCVSWSDLTRQDLEAALESVRMTACTRCGGRTFEVGFQGPECKGLCDRCSLADMRAVLGRLDDAQQRAQIRMDAKAWAQGSRWRVLGWVHPKRGGDDYPVLHYFSRQPSKQEVHALFAREGSAITQDYAVHELAQPRLLQSAAQDFVEVAVGCPDAEAIHSMATILGGRQVGAPRRGVRAYRFLDDGSRAHVELRGLKVSAVPDEAHPADPAQPAQPA
jgi:hypothetical protein